MANFFSPDSLIYKFMQRLTDVFKLNMLWLLFSLPIVTIGVSTIAACTVSLQMAEEREGRIAHTFVAAFKANLKQGIPMSFITLLCIWAIYIDIQICRVDDSHPIVFLIIGIVAAYIFIFSLIYAYPLLARYENTIARTLKNSFRIGMKYFLRSVGLILIVAFELAVIFWNTKTLFVGLLIGPEFIIFTICSFAMPIFRELEKKPETVVDTSAEAGEDE